MDIEHKLDEIEAICEQRGKRLTPTRRQVLMLFFEQGRSMRAYELLEAMIQTHTNAKPPTIYRALEFLEAEGFIHRVDSLNAWSICQHIHDHDTHHDSLLIACINCGKVKEIHDTISDKLSELIYSNGFRPAKHETEIRAICEKCAQAEST